MKRLASCAILCSVALVPALAAGQSTLTVLGLRSAAADEAMAARVTEALRQAAESASSETGFQHSGRENDLSQLLLAFGCDEPEPRCLRQIGEGLGSDRLIYGRVEGRPGRAGYSVTLAFFNVQTGAVERTLQEVLPPDMVEGEALLGPVSRYYAALTGTVVRGELAIRCAVEGAEVRVNGEAVGTTGDEPIVLRDLAPGPATVTVTREGYEPFEETVTVEAGRLAEVEVTLAEGGGGTGVTGVGTPGGGGEEGDVFAVPVVPGPRSSRRAGWLAGGWTSLGLGVVFAALGLWASLEVYGSVEGDGIISRERDCWPGSGGYTYSADDLGECPGAGPLGVEQDYVPDLFAYLEEHPSEQPRSEDLTRDELFSEYDRVQLMQTLQFVFYGLAVVGAGVGIFLLVSEYTREPAEAGGDEEASALRLSLTPMVWEGGGALAARLLF